MTVNTNQEILLLGIGHPYRHDDAVGLHVAQSIQQQGHSHVQVKECTPDGTELMTLWSDANYVLVVDAVQSGYPAGTIHRFLAHRDDIPAHLFQTSTHHWGIAEAIEMSKVLDQMPDFLMIYGIEGGNFEPGEGISSEVDQAKTLILKELQEHIEQPNPHIQFEPTTEPTHPSENT